MSFNGSLETKCMSLNTKSCIARPIFIDLNAIELNYYPFMVSLCRCNGSCNAFYDLSGKICVPNKTKDVNVKVLNMIARINESKTLVRPILYDCKCKFNPDQGGIFRGLF